MYSFMSYNRVIIEKKLKKFLAEDSAYKDVSSEFIPKEAQSSAKIIAKSNGYISGLEELKILYEYLKVDIVLKKKDGDAIKKGDIIAKLMGSTRNIVFGERVGLNLITHMSAITSTTREFVNKIKSTGKQTRIACTRKTTPGLRIFDKKAVELGGGEVHRFSLDDMILLKDTHLRFYNGDIRKLLLDVKQKASFSKKIEIEIEKVEDILIAVENGANIVMLDNMKPEEVKSAISLLEKNNLRDKVTIEISGGITINNILDYLDSEPDIISTSQLTQFPIIHVDLSLRFE